MKKDKTKVLSRAIIEAEFELATTGMDFSTEEGAGMRQLFYTYFVAGVLFAQEQLTSDEIWTAQTREELALATQKLIQPGDTNDPSLN